MGKTRKRKTRGTRGGRRPETGILCNLEQAFHLSKKEKRFSGQKFEKDEKDHRRNGAGDRRGRQLTLFQDKKRGNGRDAAAEPHRAVGRVGEGARGRMLTGDGRGLLRRYLGSGRDREERKT